MLANTLTFVVAAAFLSGVGVQSAQIISDAFAAYINETNPTSYTTIAQPQLYWNHNVTGSFGGGTSGNVR